MESRIEFRTGRGVSLERVRQEVESKGGTLLSEFPEIHAQPISPLDHRQVLAKLKENLQDCPVRIVPRIGLTLQQLQRDLNALRPELVLLYCHGTPEGCLLLEDGRARADFIPGERLFPLLRPRPRVLFLSACYSEVVLQRAGKAAVSEDSAMVYIKAETPVEVGASAAFQAEFYTALLRGEWAGDAFEAARQYVADDSDFGDLSIASDKTPPSAKFCLQPGGEAVCLSVPAVPLEKPSEPTLRQPRVRRISRTSERFVGRRWEMAQSIDELLPLAPGIHHGPEAGGRRIVTLTKEGGIGKTAMAVEIADWIEERGLFSGGIFELPCERFTHAQAWLSQLLSVLGLSAEKQSGDLLELLAAFLSRAFPPEQPALLVLDNLDDLFSLKGASATRKEVEAVLETALTAAPTLRVLATCRWLLGLSDHEKVVEVLPLDEDEARDVFLSHLASHAHKARVMTTWQQPDSAIRQLVRLSGRHPLSLRLLARQMGRKGMTLERLCQEARDDLLKMLADPLAAEDETDRLKKVQASFELSYRHLSEPGKRLFERLSRLPGGVWCGEFAERFLVWEELLGQDWRKILEKELDFYALVHYEPLDTGAMGGCFVMLPSMLEFARQKYRSADQKDWEASWIAFWRRCLDLWSGLIKGRIPEDSEVEPEQRGSVSAWLQQTAKLLFEQTQANWLAAFEAAASANDGPATRWFLLASVGFLNLSGQRILLRRLAEQAVEVLRASGPEEDLAPCLITLGNVLSDLGQRAEARQVFEEALRLYRKLAAVHPATFEPAVAATLNNLGNVLSALGQRAEARQVYQEALTIRRKLAAVHPAAFEPDVATTLNNVGTVLSDLGEWAEARQVYQEALTIRRKLAAVHPAAFEPDVATTLNNVGNVLSALGEQAEARQVYQEALTIRRKLAAVHPAAFEPDVAMTLNNLGAVLSDLGEWAEARQVHQEALRLYQKLAAMHPAAFESYVAGTLNNLGNVLSDLGKQAEARQVYQEALTLYKPLVEQWPQAFGQNFFVVLRNYTRITKENEQDPWWQYWKSLQKEDKDTEGKTQ